MHPLFGLAHPLVHLFQFPSSPSLEPLMFNVPFFIACVLFCFSLLIFFYLGFKMIGSHEVSSWTLYFDQLFPYPLFLYHEDSTTFLQAHIYTSFSKISTYSFIYMIFIYYIYIHKGYLYIIFTYIKKFVSLRRVYEEKRRITRGAGEMGQWIIVFSEQVWNPEFISPTLA